MTPDVLPRYRLRHRHYVSSQTPIREGIENLPQAIKFPPIQLLGEASGEASKKEKPYDLGEIAEEYLQTPPLTRDTTFGIRNEKGVQYIGNKQIAIANNNILIGRDKDIFKGTPGLWELIMTKRPKYYTDDDLDNYARLMIKTNALHLNNDPNNPYPKSSDGFKWMELLRHIWCEKEEYEGKGVVVIPSDPNALLKRLDLLLSSQKAGHTGFRNELVSTCDELKRQGVFKFGIL